MPSLEEDIDAAVKVFGTENLGLIWGLGQHPWKSAEERDAFLNAAKMIGANGG